MLMLPLENRGGKNMNMNINILGQQPRTDSGRVDIGIGDANSAFALEAELIDTLSLALRRVDHRAAQKCASSIEDMKKRHPAHFSRFLDAVVQNLRKQ